MGRHQSRSERSAASRLGHHAASSALFAPSRRAAVFMLSPSAVYWMRPLATEIADDRLAEVQAHAGLADRWNPVRRIAPEVLARQPHGIGGASGVPAVVGARNRRAPEGDDRVADELVDHPAMIEHHRAQHVEIAIEQRRHHLGRHCMRKLGEAFEIAEQCKDLALLAMQREQFGLGDDLLGDVARQVFAQRGLGKTALGGAHRARRGACARKGDDPNRPPSRNAGMPDESAPMACTAREGRRRSGIARR